MSSSQTPSYEELLRFWQNAQESQKIQEQKRLEEKRRDEALLGFKVANSDLPLAFDGCFIQLENPDCHIRLHLELQEDATIPKIRENWHIIKEWQRRLFRRQGPWTRGGTGGLFTHIDELLKDGLSYNDLADRLNRRLVKELNGYLAYERGLEKASSTFKTMYGAFTWRWWELEGVNPAGLDRALWVLGDLGISKDDAETWCNEILSNLRKGKPPFLPDGGPITGDRVREKLRYWRESLHGVGKTG